MLVVVPQYFLEAAELYEMAGNQDQAAVLYARLKNWNKVGQLIDQVTQPKVHILYAKVRITSQYTMEHFLTCSIAGQRISGPLQGSPDVVRNSRRF